MRASCKNQRAQYDNEVSMLASRPEYYTKEKTIKL